MSPAAVAIKTLRHPVQILHLDRVFHAHRPAADLVITLPEPVPELNLRPDPLDVPHLVQMLGTTPLTPHEREITISRVASINQISLAEAARLVAQACCR